MSAAIFLFAALAFLLVPAYADQTVTIASSPAVEHAETGKQIQIAADLRNGQDIEQDFAYIVQIQDKDGITVSLSWITGTLLPAQSLSPAVSWIPQETGTYDATIFVWESVTNPSALSPTLSLRIEVGQAA